MSEEEYLRNSEIAKIVHDYIQRGIGCDYDIFNSPPPPIPIRPVKVKTLKERLEETKMEATSVWKIDGIDKIWITQDGDEISLLLKNRDDLTKIILIGEAIKNHNDNFITTLKADLEENEKEFSKQEKKIRELKEDKEYAEKLNKELIDRWQERYGNILEENKLLKTENQHLREDIMRLKGDLHNIKTAKAEEPSSRRDILRCAEKCVCGQREQDYGTPESNFQLIADLWNDYLKKERSSIVVDAKDVAMMMALMKIARIRNGGGSGDSFVDLAGYAACGGEIWHSNQETNTDSN